MLPPTAPHQPSPSSSSSSSSLLDIAATVDAAGHDVYTCKGLLQFRFHSPRPTFTWRFPWPRALRHLLLLLDIDDAIPGHYGSRRRHRRACSSLPPSSHRRQPTATRYRTPQISYVLPPISKETTSQTNPGQAPTETSPHQPRPPPLGSGPSPIAIPKAKTGVIVK